MNEPEYAKNQLARETGLIRQVVRHDGDCSCFRWDLEICDCGALRKKVSNGKFNDDGDANMTWNAWAVHLAALDRSKLDTATKV